MARVELAPGALQDLERIAEHLHHFALDEPAATVASVVAALRVLSTSPLIGRPAKSGKHELIIGKRARGYVALYRYLARSNRVVVLAIRAQREGRYRSSGRIYR